MSDLIGFLRARLDEDEQIARGAALSNPGTAATHWSAEKVEHQCSGGSWRRLWGIVPARVKGVVMAISEIDILPKVVTHIARHDPARVLRDVAAKREIVDQYARCLAWRKEGRPVGSELLGLFYALVALAKVYADHPDHREDWSS